MDKKLIIEHNFDEEPGLQRWIRVTRSSFATNEDWEIVCDECEVDSETAQSITIYISSAIEETKRKEK